MKTIIFVNDLSSMTLKELLLSADVSQFEFMGMCVCSYLSLINLKQS
jgi:hypothetical protein